jgi:hypothetical protein
MMVKMHPQHSHMTVRFSPSADLLPPATCHFRHTARSGRNCSNDNGNDNMNTEDKRGRKGRGFWRKNVAGKIKGRDCWDRASVAQAAADRAKVKADEKSSLEDQLLEMCIKESLLEAERMAGSSSESPNEEDTCRRRGRHCWDRASVAQAAANRAMRRSGGYHQWEHVATAVDEKPAHQTSFLRKGQGIHNCGRGGLRGPRPEDWEQLLADIGATNTAARQMASKKKAFLRQGQGRHNWDRAAVDQAMLNRTKQRKMVIAEMKDAQEAKEDAHLHESLLAMYEQDGVSSALTLKRPAALPALAALASTAPQKKSARRPCSDTIASAFKEGVQWEISASSRPTTRSPSFSSLPSPPSVAPKLSGDNASGVVRRESIKWVICDDKSDGVADTINSENFGIKASKLKAVADKKKTPTEAKVDDELLEQQKKQMQFDHDVSQWGHELEVLCDMGFSNLEQLVPLLKTHVGTPAAAQEPGANLSEVGLQAVVLVLLTGAH